MCGTCGTLILDGGRPADPELVRQMSLRLAHRSSVDEGVWAESPIALGHWLSMIDLENGRPTLSNEDCSVCSTCDGEVDKLSELTDELCRMGQRIGTRADTEVLVCLDDGEGYDEVLSAFHPLLVGQ